MTEMDHSRPSIVRPHNTETSPVLRVEDPASALMAPRYTDTTTPTKLDKQVVAEINGNVPWGGRNGVDLQFKAPSQSDINANTENEKRAKSPGLKVQIPPANDSSSPRRESSPNTPSQYANPSYAYNSPTPTASPQNPFSAFVNDNDSASEKSDLISRGEETNQDLRRNELARNSKQKSGSKKAGLKAFLRQSSKDTDSSSPRQDSSSSSRSNTPSPMPSPSPTSLTFKRKGSGERGKDEKEMSSLPVANGKVGKDKSPARVLRYNTSDGCILFEEDDDDGEIV